MEFSLLGPLEVRRAGTCVPLGAPKARQVLAALLLEAGTVVPVQRLIDLLWGQRPPASARATVQVYVSQVRGVLAVEQDAAAVVTVGGGYRLDTDPENIDLFRFRSLVRRSRSIRDPRSCAAVLREALALWRGRPLVDVVDDEMRERLCAGLDAERLDALEARVDADLRAGRHADIVAEVSTLVSRHPMRERLTGTLMLCLYRCGRKAEALAAFRDLRRLMAEELGIEPSVALQQLHQAVLSDDPSCTESRIVDPAPRPTRGEGGGATGSRLVGRESERAILHQLLDDIAVGRTRFVEVLGEPGIGKTSLLGDMVRQARRRRIPALRGQAGESERDAPFAPLLDALSDELVPPRFEAADSHHGVLDALRRAANADATPAGRPRLVAERYELHRELTRLLGLLAGSRGLLLVLDDLHWADAGTVELLRYLLRHPPRHALLVAVGYRPQQAPARLRTALSAGCLGDGGHRIQLGPLCRGEAEELMGTGLSRSRRDTLYRQSGGNPFYLEALARYPVEAARDDGKAGPSTDAEVPVSVRAALLAEWERLSNPARLAAQAAAVLDDPFEPGLLAATADLSETATRTAIEELSSRDLIRPAGGPQRFRHRHPLLRQVYYQSTSLSARLAAHARAAEALAARGASATTRARHVERIGRPGDERSVAILLEAARAAAPRSPASAAHWYQAALRLLPPTTEPDRRIALQQDLANALGLSGRLAASREVFHDILRSLPADAASDRAQVVLHCALMDQLLGRHTEASELLNHELAHVDRHSMAAATLKLALGSGSILGARPAHRGAWQHTAAAHTHVEQALELARRHRSRSSQAFALAVLAMTGAGRWKTGRVATHLDEAASLVDAMTDDELATRLDGAGWIGWCEVHLERYDAALGHLRRGLSIARRTGQNHVLTYLLLATGSTWRSLGNLGRARDCLDDAMESALLYGSDQPRVLALATLSRVENARGDVAVALDLAAQAVRIAGPVEAWYSQQASAALAEARLANDDPMGAIEEITGSCGTGIDAVPELFRLDFYQTLVDATLALDRVDEARDWVRRGDRLAATLGLAGRHAQAALCRAHLLAHEHRFEAAAEQAVNAAENFDRIHSPLRAGQSRRFAATAWAGAHRDDLAAQQSSLAEKSFALADADPPRHPWNDTPSGRTAGPLPAAGR